MENLLYIAWHPDEYIVRLGAGGIRWYGACWLVGLGLGYLLMRWLYKRHKYSDAQFDPLFIYVFLGALFGARLGHCFFYQPDVYFASFEKFVEIFLPIRFLADGDWKFVGYLGLASHGGVVGLLIGLWFYIRRSGMPAWVVLDFMGICSAVTSVFIRIGNLMNSEIIGKPTDVPWAFIFYDVDTLPRHPGQLYEAIAYFVFFWIIFFVYRRYPQKVGSGLYFGLCLTLIFTFRFFIEYTKEIQVAFEAGLPMDMGQILSIPLIALGLWATIRGVRQK